MPAGDDPDVLDVAEAAAMLLTDANQVRKWANAGVLPAHRVPGTRRYLFRRSELEAWIKNDSAQ